MEFDVRQGGKPVTELDFACEKITDRSGQMFWITTQGSNQDDNGHQSHFLQVAPWSDDPIWKIRMNLLRRDGCSMVEESELFRFDHLPVPQGKRTEVNRSITRDGVTFYVSAIEHTEYNDFRVGLEYWVPEGKDPKRRVLIQDARDDQGRTHRTEKNDTTPIVSGPVGGTTEGQGYSIKLAPDARWWDVTVLLDTAWIPATTEKIVQLRVLRSKSSMGFPLAPSGSTFLERVLITPSPTPRANFVLTQVTRMISIRRQIHRHPRNELDTRNNIAHRPAHALFGPGIDAQPASKALQ